MRKLRRPASVLIDLVSFKLTLCRLCSRHGACQRQLCHSGTEKSSPHARSMRMMPKMKGASHMRCSFLRDYLFENWGARRAAFRPYFLRSFMRGSRVR